MEGLQALLKYQKEISDIQHTINILNWELKVSAPKKAEEEMINLVANYENKLFILQTKEEYGTILQNTIRDQSFIELEEQEQRYILNLLKRYNENKKVPADFYTEYITLQNRTNIIWKEAKEKNDYALFKPYLNKMIQMTKEYYRYIDNETPNLYDVMLNQYETGVTSDLIDQWFTELKERILPLIRKNRKKRVYSPKIKYTETELIECAKYLLEYIGFDLEKGKLGIYPHGFTEKISQNDIRIAFKHTDDPLDFITTIIHEGGHGIFEQGIKDNLSRYENVTIDNLYALHESQSRFYENILGRNINFWIPIYDKISKKLHLEMSLQEFIETLNTVTPNLIRTESDELTYCMHIILRYEIERDIFNDQITVDHIPQIWNQKMKEYLDIDVEKDSDGVLQDVHWSQGSFGYFPSYLLGTIYDGIFIELVEENLGNIDELLKNAQIRKITDYLCDTIYQNGGAYRSEEIIKKMYKKEISVEPVVKYFEKKYGKIK